MAETISVNVQDLVNLKKIEKGDILVLYTDGFGTENAEAISKATGAFVIASPRELGPIEKMTRADFLNIAERLNIKVQQ